MKKMLAALLMLTVMLGLFSGCAQAEVEQNPLLDAAFSLIEEGNIFLERYNQITGANVEAKFVNGVPYMFGGKGDELFLSQYPNYAKRKCWETTKFYRKNSVYIYGLDCSGYTQWIYAQCGKPAHDSLSNMILKWDYERNGNHLYNHRKGNEMPPYNELKDHLIVGDLLVGKNGARHIMMYIGTLADYGFTAEEVPELADYLDYPLVIHSGPSPVYGARFDQVIAENPDLYGNCKTTNGGVQVSILGIPLDEAPYQEHVQIDDYSYYMLEDTVMTIWDLPGCTSFCWFRM
ncbi:MAG: NlpC/P60 family protein [Clostridiales bacterium]|nr:NlpC/P60 family protein [Clostridiales bacterium]